MSGRGQRGRHRLGLALVAGLCLTTVIGRAADRAAGPPSAGETLRVGAPLPWVSGWTPDNHIVNRTRLLDARTRPLAIVLFATWCRPCEGELKRLARERARVDAAGVDLLLVDVGERGLGLPAWLAARGLRDVPVVVDPFGQIGRALGATRLAGEREETTLPRTVVIDAKGTVSAVLAESGAGFVDALLTAARQKAP